MLIQLLVLRFVCDTKIDVIMWWPRIKHQSQAGQSECYVWNIYTKRYIILSLLFLVLSHDPCMIWREIMHKNSGNGNTGYIDFRRCNNSVDVLCIWKGVLFCVLAVQNDIVATECFWTTDANWMFSSDCYIYIRLIFVAKTAPSISRGSSTTTSLCCYF